MTRLLVWPFRCLVFRWLWVWFAVPLGAPSLSLWHVMGLSLLWMAGSGMPRLDGLNEVDRTEAAWALASYALALVWGGVLVWLDGLMG